MSQVIGSTFSGIKQNGTLSTLWRITSAMCCEKKLKLNRKMTELFRSHFSSSGLPAPRSEGVRGGEDGDRSHLLQRRIKPARRHLQVITDGWKIAAVVELL